MENATKALMIAGAVLIAIMLISVSLFIFNSAQDTFNGAASKMSSGEKDMFNSQFTGYEGTNKAGSTVKTLISAVITNNHQMVEEGTEDKCVKMEFDKVKDAPTEVTSDVKALESARTKIISGKKYTVEVSTASSGLVDTIKVTQTN